MFWLLTPLWVLFLILRGTLINQAGGGRVNAMVKAQVTEARFTSLISNGGSFGGDITVNGTHTVTGDTHITGNLYGSGTGTLDMGGQIHHHGHQMNGVQEIYDNGSDFGMHGGNLYMNGGNINLGGGSQGTAHVFG